MKTLFAHANDPSVPAILGVCRNEKIDVEELDALRILPYALERQPRDLLLITVMQRNVRERQKRYIEISRAKAKYAHCIIVCLVPDQDVCGHVLNQIGAHECVIINDQTESEWQEQLSTILRKYKKA